MPSPTWTAWRLAPKSCFSIFQLRPMFPSLSVQVIWTLWCIWDTPQVRRKQILFVKKLFSLTFHSFLVKFSLRNLHFFKKICLCFLPKIIKMTNRCCRERKQSRSWIKVRSRTISCTTVLLHLHKAAKVFTPLHFENSFLFLPDNQTEFPEFKPFPSLLYYSVCYCALCAHFLEPFTTDMYRCRSRLNLCPAVKSS